MSARDLEYVILLKLVKIPMEHIDAVLIMTVNQVTKLIPGQETVLVRYHTVFLEVFCHLY